MRQAGGHAGCARAVVEVVSGKSRNFLLFTEVRETRTYQNNTAACSVVQPGPTAEFTRAASQNGTAYRESISAKNSAAFAPHSGVGWNELFGEPSALLCWPVLSVVAVALMITERLLTLMDDRTGTWINDHFPVVIMLAINDLLFAHPSPSFSV